ncbi:beta-lactamase-like protein [Podospora aff. communis PSN243]|uniref:Beta-lactamase-like protein n=1 Tax=Podospora aff. communis PSN243 TaxID=3040156 RepID=A0AAV9FYG6_9PEZI|nr:beta-lactamase-like protein [Podospora aff. communis PSN243]
MVIFAEPLAQSTRSEILEWRFPKPYHNYVLTGRSRAAWHTSFVIPQLNLLLDAGLCVNNLRPKHIFLTHGHSDHTLLAPAFGNREDPPDVFCPAEMETVFNTFCQARTLLNMGGLITADDINSSLPSDSETEDTPPPTKPPPPSKKGGTPALDNAPKPSSNPLIRHNTHPIRPGDTVPLRRTHNISATAFPCDHTIPCVGYLFSQTTLKLLPQYTSLPGPELRRLRQEAGVTITGPVTTPIFAFLGDGTASTLLSEPRWLKDGVPVVITECSFLYEEHRRQAEKTKHTLWGDLEGVVKKWKGTTFVVTHFSLRYSEEEVRGFFRKKGEEGGLENLVVWCDGGE